MKKLKKKTGETIAETLVAVLIMAIAFVIMTGAVAASARINEKIKNDENAFRVESPESSNRAFTLSVYQSDFVKTDDGAVGTGEAEATCYVVKLDDEKPDRNYYYYD